MRVELERQMIDNYDDYLSSPYKFTLYRFKRYPLCSYLLSQYCSI